MKVSANYLFPRFHHPEKLDQNLQNSHQKKYILALMKTRYTLDFFDEPDFTILAINSHAKGYKLCWCLNQKLHFDFAKTTDHKIGERLFGYALTIKPQRRMTFKYNGKEYAAYGSSNYNYGGNISPNYRPNIERYMDKLLLDYLKANPKKKE